MYTLEQQKEHRKLWVVALRSGKYRQGTGMLHEGGRYCCLGVACIIAGCDNAELGRKGTLGSLPEVMSFYGLKTYKGNIDFEDSLTDRNDTGSSFDAIADIIEREPKGLFVEGDAP